VLIPILSCIFGSLIMGLIYSFLTVTLRANQNVTGLALTTFGVGVGNFFGGSLIKLTDSDLPSITLTQTSNYFKTTLPFADKLGWFGEIFLSYSFLAYVAIAIALLAAFYFNRTRSGLSLRAVGENPATADAAGINVSRYRYVATCVGSGIAGLGGLFYIMDYLNGMWEYNIDDMGWLAVALVIFAVWRPNLSIFGSMLFGALYIASSYITSWISLSLSMKPLFQMLPYLVTVIVLVVTSIRNKKENQPPQSMGLTYFREER
jgi:simple sugar transport system permease protein